VDASRLNGSSAIRQGVQFPHTFLKFPLYSNVSEVIRIIIEGLITFIIAAALFYVAPGVLSSIKSAAPVSIDDQLNASQVQIATTVAGGLNLSSISLIMLGIGIMIGGFMLIRGRQ
jgi:hypothetical protein